LCHEHAQDLSALAPDRTADDRALSEVAKHAGDPETLPSGVEVDLVASGAV
jgi:hypothetical protein